jgi:hypothetical protein
MYIFLIATWVFPDFETAIPIPVGPSQGTYHLIRDENFMPSRGDVLVVIGNKLFPQPGHHICHEKVICIVNETLKYYVVEPTTFFLIKNMDQNGERIYLPQNIFYADGYREIICNASCLFFSSEQAKNMFSSDYEYSENYSIGHGIFDGNPLYLYMNRYQKVSYSSTINQSSDIFINKYAIRTCETEIPLKCRKEEFPMNSTSSPIRSPFMSPQGTMNKTDSGNCTIVENDRGLVIFIAVMETAIFVLLVTVMTSIAYRKWLRKIASRGETSNSSVLVGTLSPSGNRECW